MRRTVRLFGGLATTGAALIALATPAWAHVTVTAPGVAPGASDATITVRVPDESDRASTVGLKLQLPTDHPLPGVLVAPLPGWTATVKQTKLASPIKTDDGDISQVVSEIDWTATPGAGIKPGFFGQFTLIAGQLPDGVTSLTFKAVQQYSDGSSTSWIEQPAAGNDQAPEHPAPVLTLSGSASHSSGTDASSSESDGSSNLATTGVVLGAIGVLLGGAALAVALRRR